MEGCSRMKTENWNVPGRDTCTISHFKYTWPKMLGDENWKFKYPGARHTYQKPLQVHLLGLRCSGMKTENWNVLGRDPGCRLLAVGWPPSISRWVTLYRADGVSILSGNQFYRTINYAGQSIIPMAAAVSSQPVLRGWPGWRPIWGPASCNLFASLLCGNHINLAINNGRLSDVMDLRDIPMLMKT